MRSFAMNAGTLEALSRTLLLLRDHVRHDIPDALIGQSLLGTRVALIGDRRNMQFESAQHALVTTALLAARWGADLRLLVPDVPLMGVHAPLVGDHLESALLDVLQDLIPDVTASAVLPADGVDVAVLFGDTRWSGRAARVIRMQANDWSGAIVSGGGIRWRDYEAPFGALAAAGLAAGEAFKRAVVSLRPSAINPRSFDETFEPTREAVIHLAPSGTPPPVGELDRFDCVSGGAIIQAALYALARIRNARGDVRLIEPEASEITNLNRYSLLRRSRTNAPKAIDLATVGLVGLRIEAVTERYDAALRARIGAPAPVVLVGVDDIPSRWEVQAAQPAWLGIGATTHYSAMASYHVQGLGCARCLHPRDEPGGAPIPTVSFVSHWAGLWLASLFVREQVGARPPREQQTVFFSPLRPESPTALWLAPVHPREDCPHACGQR